MADKKTTTPKTEPKTKRGQGDSITLRLVKGDKRDDELRARLNDHVNELAKLGVEGITKNNTIKGLVIAGLDAKYGAQKN
jgi:hypothetical protein